MERAIARRNKAMEDHAQWRRVVEANKATLATQPTNQECMRAVNTSQTRAIAAAEDERAAGQEYEDAKSALHSAIEHRDDMVEGATEASQMAEDDRLETMTLILHQFVQTKQAALVAEMEALKELAKVVGSLDRNAALQQYIVDHMQPDITHRHSKAMFLVEWHWKWHLERVELAKSEPEDYLNLTSDSIRCLQEHNITVFDVEVMKEFVASCFVTPDLSRMIGSERKVPTKHRHRFVDPTAGRALYRLDVVRQVILAALNHQRAFGVELTVVGYEMLVAALTLLLHGCLESGDTRCAKSVMNMAQTFYCTHKHKQHYLLPNLVLHPLWQTAHFWGDAVLLGIGEELSRHSFDTPWQCLSASARAALVVTVHNVVFGQLSTFVYNMASFRLSRHQIRQFVQTVALSFELSEDQRMALLAAVAALSIENEEDGRAILGGDAALFTTAIFPEWRKTAPPKDTAMQALVGHGLSRIKGIFDRDMDKASSQVLLANAQKAKNDDQWADLFGDVAPPTRLHGDAAMMPPPPLVEPPEMMESTGRRGDEGTKSLRRRPKSNNAISDFIPPMPMGPPPPALMSPNEASTKKQRPRSSNSVILAEAAFEMKPSSSTSSSRTGQPSTSTSRNRTSADSSDDDVSTPARQRRPRARYGDATGVAALRSRFERMQTM
ncbi:hypothetical protein, variant 1 [Aphanomyces astaci]|nr:hypothetical protein, variant 1 [Aphanomyces astaci]ETV70069.1 hypothetical protein, variant 1 [Aphanomyces astaci]|eukprot:XP_009840512.1 hypothetical protein, variant 1 [Aphanomyces astaci]